MTSEEMLEWHDKAAKYANDYFKDAPDLAKAMWMRDALYVAYLRGVEQALGKRLV
jgi:hypothetical protein